MKRTTKTRFNTTFTLTFAGPHQNATVVVNLRTGRHLITHTFYALSYTHALRLSEDLAIAEGKRHTGQKFARI